MAVCDINIATDTNVENSEEVRLSSSMPLYYQLNHKIINDDCFLINSIIIESDSQSNTRTLVVYSHMLDFNYSKLPSIIEIANGCQELEDVVAN
jgi:hypothetical protein